MVQAIDILTREHRWIGWMVTSLASLTSTAKADDILPEEAYELLTLFEVFADGRHQDKEEQVLFPALLAAAEDGERQALGQLLRDHEVERAYLTGMRNNVLGAVHGDPASVRGFLREADGYLRAHRSHMLRETALLFPLAERLLDEASDRACVEGFARIEGGAGDPHGVREQILGLYRRIGIPPPPAA